LNIFHTQVNGVDFLSWDSSETYSWVVIDNILYLAATEEKKVALDIPIAGKHIDIVSDNSTAYEWWLYIGDAIKTQIRVAFYNVTGAKKYRVKIDSEIVGRISDTNAESFEFISSNVTEEKSYQIDVEWQDEAGNWSSTLHDYDLYMYIVPDGQTFALSVPVAGQLTVTAT